MERFSIREYTSKMRSVDVLKCWPFGQTKIEYIEDFLPPITVQKFRWWMDELENEATEEEGAVVGRSCPVCLVFKAASVKTMSAHRCVGQSSKKEHSKMKSKSRVPKKRSIVELFAVAPQVEKVYEDEDEDEDHDVLSTQDDVKLSALIRIGLHENRKRRRMKLIGGTLATNTMDKFKKKRMNDRKKEREANAFDLSTNRKEKFVASRQKNTFDLTRDMKGSSRRKDLLDAIPVQKKNPCLKSYMSGKKTKPCGSSKLTLGQQKPVISFPGILKNHSQVVSGQKSTIGTFLEPDEVNWCGSNQSNRHVRFSCKDDILGRRMNSVPHAAASLDTNYSAEEREEFVIRKANRSDCSSSINKENGNEAHYVTEKQSSDMCLCVEKLNLTRPRISQEHLKTPVTLNQVPYCSEDLQWLDHGYKVASPDPSSPCPPRFLSTGPVGKGAHKPNRTAWNDEDMSMSSKSNGTISHYGDGPMFSATCSVDYRRAFPQASTSDVTRENGNGCGRLQFPPKSTSDMYNGQHSPYYHPIPHLSPKELMRSICSVPDMEPRNLMHIRRSINEDIVGLPLNSHGEFIHMHSNGMGEFNQVMRPTMVTDSSRSLAFCTEQPNNQEDHYSFRNFDERSPSEKQIHFVSFQGQEKEKPNFLVSAASSTPVRNDVSLDFFRGGSHSVFPRKSGLNMMSIPSQSNKNDQIRNCSNDRNMYQGRRSDLMLRNGTQPTMRLMGQEFSVGKNYRNLHEETLWTDNQVIVHRDGGTTTNEPSRRRFQPDLIMPQATGKNKKIACSSEIQVDMDSSVLQIIPPDSRFTSPALGCQTNAVYENACHAFDGAPVPQPYSFRPDTSPAILNKEFVHQKPFVCEYEALPTNHPEVRSSSSLNTFQNMRSNFAESSRKSSQPYSTGSAFKFPFLCTELASVRPYPCQSSLNSIHPWSLNGTQSKEPLISSFLSCSDAVDSHPPCTVSSNNFAKTRSVCCTPDVSYMYNPVSIPIPLQHGPDLACVARPPPVPLCPRFLPNSTMNNKREYRLRFKERMKARLGLKNPPNGKRTKKRPVTKSNYSSKPTQLPSIGIPEDLSHGVAAFKAIGDTEIDVQEGKETLRVDRANYVANNTIHCQNSTQIDARKAISEMDPILVTEMDASKAISEIDLSTGDGITSAGPVKLTAGTKHILNPTEYVYGSNSKMTHTKIPLPTLSCSELALESPTKPSKIYQF